MANITVYPYGTDGQLPSSIGIIDDLVTGGRDKALSAEQGKILNEKIESQEAVDLSDYELIGSWLTANNVWRNFVSNQGKFIPIPSNVLSITIVGHNNSSTSFTSVYALLTTDEHIAGSAVSYATGCERNLLAYNTSVKIINIPNDARFLWVGSLADYVDVEPQSVTFGADIWSAIDGLDADVQFLQNEMEDSQSNTLFIGNLVQKNYDSNAVLSDTDADKRVTTESYMSVPKESATLRFKLPEWLQCTIRAGRSCDQDNPVSSQLRDGSTYAFGSDKMWFRICFMRLDTTALLSVADVNEAIASGDLKIYVEGEHSNIIERNAESEVYIKAVMRPFVSGQTKNSGFNNYPVFAHTSDVHGDATRFNSMVDYCDYIGVDACLVTGDMVSKEPKDSMQFVNDIADSHNSIVLPCMGNHDARTLTAEEQYNSIMKYLVEKNSATTNPNENYPTYYYKDFASKKIRLIALNIYEGTRTHDNVNFSQTQAEWFISVLASTPQDYGVLVMFHSPDKLPAKDNDHAAFYQDIVVTTTTTMANIAGNPFIQIIDAFIGKSSATISYSIGSTSISVVADFTGVASGVEFIAFLNGHFHIDRIGYLPSTTYKQLNLNVSCGIAEYGGSSNAYYADCSDMPRGCVGSTQDCFNIYVIDRATKSVRVARVGSNIAGNLTERKFMVIPYAD